MINRIDEIVGALECAAVDSGFSLSVKDGEIVVTDLLWPNSQKPFAIRFEGMLIENVAVKPVTNKQPWDHARL